MQGLAPDMIQPALAAVFTVVFFGLWRADPARRHLMGFAIGFFALFVSMTLHLAFPADRSALGTTVFHSLACFSVIAIVWGSAERLGQKTPVLAMLAVTLISGGLFYYALATGKDAVALAVQNGASGVLFGIGAIALWLARPMSLLDKILIWTLGSIAAFGLLRPAVLILMDVEIAELVQRKSGFNAISLITITALTVVLALSLIVIAIKEAIEIRHRTKRSDPVSGFMDRQTFDYACEEALANAHRLGLPVTLAIFEIDRFDSFREEWGDETSNLAVRDLADILRTCQRDGDIVGRMSDGQFGVLLVGMGTDSGLKFACTLRDEVKRKWVEMVTGMMSVTLSCAIMEGRLGSTYQTMSEQALDSLKQAKSVGSNCIFVNGREFEAAELGEFEAQSIIAHG